MGAHRNNPDALRVACVTCHRETFRIWRSEGEGFGWCPCGGELVRYVSEAQARKFAKARAELARLNGERNGR